MREVGPLPFRRMRVVDGGSGCRRNVTGLTSTAVRQVRRRATPVAERRVRETTRSAGFAQREASRDEGAARRLGPIKRPIVSSLIHSKIASTTARPASAKSHSDVSPDGEPRTDWVEMPGRISSGASSAFLLAEASKARLDQPGSLLSLPLGRVRLRMPGPEKLLRRSSAAAALESRQQLTGVGQFNGFFEIRQRLKAI